VDYPDFAHKLCEAVLADKESFGILICGSGIGMSIAANRHRGIRAALCHDAYTAKMARAHNNANVLCFGERVLGGGTRESMIEAWINESFEGGRHAMRVDKIEIQ
jgi:ribose 5-phosphate isomerase B